MRIKCDWGLYSAKSYLTGINLTLAIPLSTAGSINRKLEGLTRADVKLIIVGGLVVVVQGRRSQRWI